MIYMKYISEKTVPIGAINDLKRYDEKKKKTKLRR